MDSVRFDLTKMDLQFLWLNRLGFACRFTSHCAKDNMTQAITKSWSAKIQFSQILKTAFLQPKKNIFTYFGDIQKYRFF